MGTSSQSKVHQLAEIGTWELCDQRAGNTRITAEITHLHREDERERRIETGTTKDIDRLAMTITAAVEIQAVIEAEAAAREGIDHRTTEALPAEK